MSGEWTREEHIPVSYLNAGRSFQLAAEELVRIETGVAFPDLPRRQCLMIAAELYLKSFLLHDGMDADEVRNLSHHVGRAANLALERGLEIGVEDQELLHMISDDKTLLRDRYVVPGARRVPRLEPLADLVHELYRQVGERLLERHPTYVVGEKRMAPRRKGE